MDAAHYLAELQRLLNGVAQTRIIDSHGNRWEVTGTTMRHDSDELTAILTSDKGQITFAVSPRV